MTLDPTWGDDWLDMAAGGAVTARRRLERGRAGAGRLIDLLQIEPGTVRVRVPGGRGRFHDVTIEVPPLSEDEWSSLVAELAGELRHTATLLEGHLPETLHGRGLVPARTAARCDCTEAQPCRHVAAAHHAIALALQRDPLRLLAIRGYGRDALRDALRARRGPQTHADPVAADLSAPFSARGALDAIEVHPVPVPDVDLLFHQLGSPPGIDDHEPIAALMRKAADLAWRLAAGEGSEAADDEALLAELRAQKVATASSLASSLGLEVEAVTEALERMHADGAVLRMGAGDTARYRAA